MRAAHRSGELDAEDQALPETVKATFEMEGDLRNAYKFGLPWAMRRRSPEGERLHIRSGQCRPGSLVEYDEETRRHLALT